MKLTTNTINLSESKAIISNMRSHKYIFIRMFLSRSVRKNPNAEWQLQGFIQKDRAQEG